VSVWNSSDTIWGWAPPPWISWLRRYYWSKRSELMCQFNKNIFSVNKLLIVQYINEILNFQWNEKCLRDYPWEYWTQVHRIILSAILKSPEKTLCMKVSIYERILFYFSWKNERFIGEYIIKSLDDLVKNLSN
jgi:hypothetical protein